MNCAMVWLPAQMPAQLVVTIKSICVLSHTLRPGCCGSGKEGKGFRSMNRVIISSVRSGWSYGAMCPAARITA